MLNSEEFKKVLEKYGDLELTFSSYYKYSFIYDCTIGDERITAIKDVEGDEMYRFSCELKETLLHLYPNKLFSYNIKTKKRTTIYEHSI